MPLTFEERKRRMPIGAQKRVAEATAVPESIVSAAMRDEWHPKTAATREKLRRVQEALAAELSLPVEEAFAPMDEEAGPMACAS